MLQRSMTGDTICTIKPVFQPSRATMKIFPLAIIFMSVVPPHRALSTLGVLAVFMLLAWMLREFFRTAGEEIDVLRQFSTTEIGHLIQRR
jgi:hypothetical protein